MQVKCFLDYHTLFLMLIQYIMKNTVHHPNKKQTALFSTVSLVTLLSVLERGLGFLYRIVLSRLIGAEGLGLYHVALSIFSLFLTIGTGGIPVTVSRFISKSKAENNLKGEREAVSAGIALCLFLTLPTVFLLFPLADKIPFLLPDKRAVSVFRILLVGLAFSSVYAVFRGSFWGNKRFLLSALLELAEETVMVIAGVLLLKNASSPVTGACLAGLSATISYLFSFTASTLCFFLFKGKLSAPKKTLKPLFNATMPITFVRGSASLVNSAIAVLLPAMLVKSGFSGKEALKLYGIVTGMAIPVLMIPSTLIGSLSVVLVPELSEDYYRKNKTRLYKNLIKGISASFILSCAIIPFFYALGEKVGALAFANSLAGEMIKKGCWILLPMSLTMITTSMLNSMGFEKHTFVYYFIGAGAMLLCILLLPSFFGAYAYIFGLGVSFIITAVCNFCLLLKKCDGFLALYGKSLKKIFLRAGFAVYPLALLTKLFASLFSHCLSAFLCVLFSSILGVICTLALYFVLDLLPKPSSMPWKRVKTGKL